MTENCKGPLKTLSSISGILHSLSAGRGVVNSSMQIQAAVRTKVPVSETLPSFLSIFELLFYLSV